MTRFVITPPATAPLANLGGYDLAISPDGERLAYFAQNPANGSVALYVRELDGLEARLVPGTEIAAPVGDTESVLLGRRQVGRLLVARPRRHARRRRRRAAAKMLDPPEPTFLGAAWAADDTLIYSSGTRLAARVGRRRRHAGASDAGDRGERRRRSRAAARRARVLFGSIAGGVERVAVLDLDTSEQKILVEGGQNPTYAETGHIVFARGTTLMAAPFDAAELALTGEPVAMLQDVRHPNPQTAADYALSATGTLVYVPGGGETDGGAQRSSGSIAPAPSSGAPSASPSTMPAIRVCRPTASGSC